MTTPAPRLPRFEEVGRVRPVELIAPGAVDLDLAAPGERSATPTPQPAPYVAVVADLPDGPDVRVALTLVSGSDRLTAELAGRRTRLLLDTAPGVSRHSSRRHGRIDPGGADGLAITLTGTHLALLTRERDEWTVRARVDLSDRVPTRDESWLAALAVEHDGRATRLCAGGFGQLGLRDLRLVTHATGAACTDETGRLLFTATSAGPGFFDTGHTSVWAWDPSTPAAADSWEHRADLFTRRHDRPGVYGDHAGHLVRDGDRWRWATSTWGDFLPGSPDATVGVTLAESTADLTTGRHLLDTRPLDLPTDGLRSVGTWDPHLVRDETGGWLVGYVSATEFFRFHPVLAAGPTLDDLSLRAADPTRSATEGTTLVELDGRRWVLASDGRDGPRHRRARYPVLDLRLEEVGELDAPYPSNLPWPTLVRDARGTWWLITFDGTPYGGPLPGYGTHGDVVVMRAAESAPTAGRR